MFLNTGERQQQQAPTCFLFLQDIHKGDGLKNPINRVYSTNAAEPWHVDDADVVGQSRLLFH